MPIYRPENFKFVSEDEWREMINKGYTDASIQNHDKEKVNEVDSFMERVTLPQNTLHTAALFYRPQTRFGLR